MSEPSQPSGRLAATTLLAAVVGVTAAGAAFGLQCLIALFTNLCWFGRVSTVPADAWDSHLPAVAIVLLPGLGGLLVGLMARYGSAKIRGHGIPEVMESILVGESRIPPRVALLKPLSAAIAIGSGGPFGAEGPIIATGGALGSILGQILPVTAAERKTLLAAGAAAGMSAMFGSPVAALVLAVELLLFEMRPRSLIPVAVASTLAYIVSRTFTNVPIFPMPISPTAETPAALLACALLGLLAGVAALGVTKVVYAVEDAFEKLPIHWMWWPPLGGLVVGAVGAIQPRVLGVGYKNIAEAISGDMPFKVCVGICIFKLIAWSISLGTGTSGGVLAPVLTVGATLGAAAGWVLERYAPGFSPGIGVSALAVMASVFAGTARCPIATIIFALELTRRVEALPAVLACVAVGQLVSVAIMKHSIMTERIARRGIPIGHEYSHDTHAVIRIRDVMTREVTTVPEELSFDELKRWFAPDGLRTKHGAYPVVNARGELVGLVSHQDIARGAGVGPVVARDLCATAPVIAYPDDSLERARELLIESSIGRLVVVERNDARRIAGILSRSDLFHATKRLHASIGAAPHAKQPAGAAAP